MAKLKLAEIKQQAEKKYIEEQTQALKAEMKEIRKQQLMRFHSLEKQLNNNVSIFLELEATNRAI
jgi:predicted alternative tryptophan synthase beta-subunit